MTDTIDHENIARVLESLKKVTFNDAFIAETLAAAKAGTLAVEDCFRLPLAARTHIGDSPFALLCGAYYNPDNAAGLSLDEHRALRREVLGQLLKALPEGLLAAPQNTGGLPILDCYLRSTDDAGGVDDEVLGGLLGRPSVNVNPPPGHRANARSPLAAAVQRGRTRPVELLLEAGADASRDKIALMTAILADKAPLIKALLGAGAGSGGKNLLSEAFYYSAKENKPVALGLLAQAPALGGLDYDNGLAYAIQAKAWPCVEMLMRHPGYTPDDSFFQDEGRARLERGVSWTAPDAEQSVMANLSALAQAGMPGEALTGYAKGLYQRRARLSLFSNAPTSLQRRTVVAHILEGLGARPCAGLLNEAVNAGAPGADLALISAHAPDQINEPNRLDGLTPLLLLLAKASLPNVKVTAAQIKALLNAGADPNMAAPNGTTALSLARRWCPDQTGLLVEMGASAGQMSPTNAAIKFA